MRACIYLLFLAALSQFPLFAVSQKQQIQFDHIGTSSGLSQSNVFCITQDSRGFMWFGTWEGLNKYDGYSITVYKNNPLDQNSLSNNFITGIAESKNGDLWIGTGGGGICRYDRNKENFTRFKHDPKNTNSLNHDFVNNILEDKRGNLWIATEVGLDMFDPVKNKFEHFTYNPDDNNSLSNSYVIYLFEDSHNNLWVCTGNGLNLFNPKNKTFTHFQHDKNDSKSIGGNTVNTMFEDSKHRLWIGTDGAGMDLFNKTSGTFLHFKHDENNANTLSSNVVVDIKEDTDNNLWIATGNGGLCIFNYAAGLFTAYKNDKIDKESISNNSLNSIYRDSKNNMWVGNFANGIDIANRDKMKFAHFRNMMQESSLSNNQVLSIHEDSKKNIWIGTDGGGLNLFNPQTGKFTHFQHKKNNTQSICGNYVLTSCEDSKGNIWVGTWADGVTVFNPHTNTFKHFKNEPENASSLSNNNAWIIYEDRDKNIWIGTSGGGINLLNPDHKSFTHYYAGNRSDELSSNNIVSFFEDSDGNMWICTNGGGLNLFDKKTKTFSRLMHDNEKNSISNNSLSSICEDSDKKLWIATRAGLNLFNKKTKQFIVYTTADGLADNVIFGILEDTKKNLWMSTNKGISCFNPSTKVFKNFDVSDGLQSKEFKVQAFCKSSSGIMYFGGVNGFNQFFPDSVKPVSFNPPLVITNFEIFNKQVHIAINKNDPSPLTKSITETRAITLPYSNTVFSFEFATLNYAVSEKKQYEYMLEGFDKNWNEVGTARIATYTHLDPGKYFFKVRGLNNEGKWSSRTATIELTITPPFWLTWWFKSLVFVFVVGSSIGFYRFRINAVKAQKKILESEVQKRTEEERIARLEAEKARQEADDANKAKSVFLATMSHEIRTPMNGVIGMADLLTETELDDEQQTYAETIKNCGENLLNIINDILDFSKIESGKIELEMVDFDLRVCIEEVLDVFALKVAKTGIDLVYQMDYNIPAIIKGDSLRLKQILINLVGNAVKFTQRGEIFVNVQLAKIPEDGKLELSFAVKDSGIGIPHNKMDTLFKAFSQVDSSTTRQYGGTGLGLVISAKLAELFGGRITVESTPGEGSIFTLTIQTAASQLFHKEVSNHTSSKQKRLLVVDDNQTNLNILKTQLEHWKMEPVLAASGEIAMEYLAEDEMFHLVLCDMQMPSMNGVEFTKNVKKLYPDLPVILLNSAGSESHKAYQSLFSSVITKPIKQQVLYRHILTDARDLPNLIIEFTDK